MAYATRTDRDALVLDLAVCRLLLTYSVVAVGSRLDVVEDVQGSDDG